MGLISTTTQFTQYYPVQDEVNYVVSEWEDEEKDVTALTRITGCTGLNWLEVGCNRAMM